MDIFDKLDGKGKWAFSPFLGWVLSFAFTVVLGGLRIVLNYGAEAINSDVMALVGAVMVCFGAVTVARPVIRVGGYKAWVEKNSVIGGGNFVPTDAEIEERRQVVLDSKAVNFTGPALAIAGTLINGVSGLLL